MTKPPKMILSQSFVQYFPSDNICAKINAEIKAEEIVSIVHEREGPDQQLIVTVYYRN